MVGESAEAHESDPLLGEKEQEAVATEDKNDSVEAAEDDDDDDGLSHAETTATRLSIIAENAEEFFEEVADFAHDIVDTVQEYAGEAKEAVIELSGDVKEAVVEELHEIADAFIEELHEADEEEDKYFFLEMNLTRNLSLLPEDMIDSSHLIPSKMPLPDPDAVHPETSIEEGKVLVPVAIEGEEKKPAVVEVETTPLSAYLLLATAVLSLSSIGPLLDFQEGVAQTMKVYWRTGATALVLLPFALNSIYRDGFPRLNYSQWVMLLLTAGSYAALCVFFVWSLKYTAVGNAIILSNSQSLMLLVGKIFVGEQVTTVEGVGAIVAFFGAVLCSKDSSEGSTAGGLATILGDTYAILSALAGVAYLVFAKTIRSSMDLYVFMFFVMFIGSLESLLFVAIVGEPISLDFDVNTGIFGWVNLQQDRLPLELIMVVLCNLFGAMGYVRAMHFFDNLVISVAALMVSTRSFALLNPIATWNCQVS